MSSSNGRILSGPADPLVVRTEQLCEYIMPIVEAQDERRRDEPRIIGKTQTQGGFAFVAGILGVDPAAVRKTLTASNWVTFGKAEEWMCALDMTHLVNELHTYPNPYWSQERWQAWSASTGGCETDWVGP